MNISSITISLILVACLLEFCAPILSRGEEYFVSTNGSDQADGSKSEPWRTIDTAVGRLNPGDTLSIFPGVYRESVSISVSGVRGKPILIRSLKPRKAILDGGGILARDRSYVTIQGFSIRNTRGDRPALEITGQGAFVEIRDNEITGLVSKNAAALRVGGRMHDFLIEGNHVHKNVTGNQEAIRVHESTHDFQILRNEVNENSNIGIDIVGWSQYGKPRNGLVRENVTRNNAYQAPWGTGIYLDGPENIVVEYNISSGNPIGFQLGCEPSDDVSSGNVMRYNLAHDNREYGLHIGGFTGGTVRDCLIHNNTFVENHREIGFSRNAGQSNILVNNILYSPSGRSINYLSRPTETIIDWNCYFVREGETPGVNSVTSNPAFVDVLSGKYGLRMASPCIDKGRDVSNVERDLAGKHVPLDGSGDGRARLDLGALEFEPQP